MGETGAAEVWRDRYFELSDAATRWYEARGSMIASPPDDKDRRRKLNALSEAESSLAELVRSGPSPDTASVVSEDQHWDQSSLRQDDP